MRLILAVLTVLPLFALGACGGKVQTPDEIAAADCSARGGVMTPVGRMQTLQCVIRYADAGKRCTDGDDCQGDCRVEGAMVLPAGREATGVCAADSNRFGCITTIESGKAEPTLCID